jgi:hypothetical protein
VAQGGAAAGALHAVDGRGWLLLAMLQQAAERGLHVARLRKRRAHERLQICRQ